MPHGLPAEGARASSDLRQCHLSWWSTGLAAHFPEREDKELKTVVIFQLAGFQAAELSFFTQSRLHSCWSSFYNRLDLVTLQQQALLEEVHTPMGATPGSSWFFLSLPVPSLHFLFHVPHSPAYNSPSKPHAFMPHGTPSYLLYYLLLRLQGSASIDHFPRDGSFYSQTELECFPPSQAFIALWT